MAFWFFNGNGAGAINKPEGNYELKAIQIPLSFEDDTVAYLIARVFEYDSATEAPGKMIFEKELEIKQNMLSHRRYELQLQPGEVSFQQTRQFFLGLQFKRTLQYTESFWPFGILVDYRKQPTPCYQSLIGTIPRTWARFGSDYSQENYRHANQLLMSAVLLKY